MSKYLFDELLRPVTRTGLRTFPTDILSQLFGDNLYSEQGSKFSEDSIRFNESQNQFRAEIDLPGVKKENLEVKSEGNRFFVSASRSITKNGGSKNETYTRFFEVNPNVYDINNMSCTLQDGMLVITVARKTSPKKEVKVIPVN